MRDLTEDDVTFSVECLPEHEDVRGNAMASGDDDVDQAVEDEIMDQLCRGNDWAWCCVRVVASWEGFHASDYLGCCSYASEADFLSGDYYSDMRATALDNLNAAVQRTAQALSKLDT